MDGVLSLHKPCTSVTVEATVAYRTVLVSNREPWRIPGSTLDHTGITFLVGLILPSERQKSGHGMFRNCGRIGKEILGKVRV
jgi:hypothetical protein